MVIKCTTSARNFHENSFWDHLQPFYKSLTKMRFWTSSLQWRRFTFSLFSSFFLWNGFVSLLNSNDFITYALKRLIDIFHFRDRVLYYLFENTWPPVYTLENLSEAVPFHLEMLETRRRHKLCQGDEIECRHSLWPKMTEIPQVMSLTYFFRFAFLSTFRAPEHIKMSHQEDTIVMIYHHTLS